MDINEIKEYPRIDHSDEDSLVRNLNNAAEQYMVNAGATILQGPLYDLALKILVTHWYENREPIGKADKLAYSLDSILVQLKYCGGGI